MTIKQLQKRLDEIPPTGIMNRARRKMIIEMINKLAAGGGR